MRTTTIIIDDDVFACKLLEEYCKKARLEVIHIFNNPIDGLTFLNTHAVDVVFLDVHMPDLNGFDFLKSSPQTQVILTTLDETKAVEAFDYDVVDFLLKPITFQRFLRAIQRLKRPQPVSPATNPINPLPSQQSGANIPATNTESNQPEFVYVNINKRLVKIAVEDINFVQANGNYVKICRTKDEDLMVHTTLKKIATKLPTEIFQKVHRSYIVNIKKIVDIEDSSIVIGRNVIPIGKDHRTRLMDKLHLLN